MSAIQVNLIAQKWPALVTSIVGRQDLSIDHVATPDTANTSSLVFILSDKQLPHVLTSKAVVILAPHRLSQDSLSADKTWILSPQPELLMRHIKAECFLSTPFRSIKTASIHPTAVIDSSAQVDKSATLCAGVVIGPRAQIGERVFIGANSVIENDVIIGHDTTIHPLVYVGHSCHIGERCEIKPNTTIGGEGYGYAHNEKGEHFRIPHSGRVILQNDVHVGSSCTLDRGTLEDTVIGQGTKIDNQCHLAHNSVVGRNGLITAQFGMAGSSKIGNNFISGGKASVTGHIEITDNVQIAGMSGVTKSIDKPGQYGGFPLQPLKDYLKTKAAMVHLHDLRKQIQSFLKNENEN